MFDSKIEGIVDISNPPKDYINWDNLYSSGNNIVEKDVDNLKIYTSYYGNSRNLHNYITISISRSTPIAVDYHLEELKPSWTELNKYKKSKDKEKYIKYYKEEVLGITSPSKVIGILRRIMIENRIKRVVLLCYEKDGDFCHRHLVSKWLRDAGYNIEEFPIHK